LTRGAGGGSVHHAEDIYRRPDGRLATRRAGDRGGNRGAFLGCAACLVPWPCEPWRRARTAADEKAARYGRTAPTVVYAADEVRR
jgi:hypothetical protein